MESLRKVLVLNTGGTIGKLKDQEENYQRNLFTDIVRESSDLHNKQDEKHLKTDDQNVFVLPTSSSEKKIVYKITTYDTLMNSSDMSSTEWLKIAKDIGDNYKDYDGFVILYGTDTMAYAASVMSFLLANLAKPVIFTGAQIPMSKFRSDGRSNFAGAIYIAGSFDIPEVAIYFNSKLLRGNRSVKVSSKHFSGFDSPDFPPLAELGLDVKVCWKNIQKKSDGELKVHSHLNANVGVLKLYPGINGNVLKSFLQPPLEGCVLETFGTGHTPSNEDLKKELKEACVRGVVIVSCSQCLSGGVIKSENKEDIECGVLAMRDVTSEAAFAKLCYVLSLDNLSLDEKKQLLLTDLRGEMMPQENG